MLRIILSRSLKVLALDALIQDRLRSGLKQYLDNKTNSNNKRQVILYHICASAQCGVCEKHLKPITQEQRLDPVGVCVSNHMEHCLLLLNITGCGLAASLVDLFGVDA